VHASIRRAVLGRLELGEVISIRGDRVRFRGPGCAGGQVVCVSPALGESRASAATRLPGGCDADILAIDNEGLCEATLRRTAPGIMPGCSVVLTPAPAPAPDPARFFNRRTNGFLELQPTGLDTSMAESAARKRESVCDTLGRQLHTGSPVIDVLHPWYAGTRMVVTGPAGAGKTTLIEALAGVSSFDHVVVVMIGERGHEIDRMVRYVSRRSTPWTVVGASSATSLHQRVAALDNGVALARASASTGRQVLLLVDSLTRWARAMSQTTRGGHRSDAIGTSLNVVERLAHTFENCLDHGSGQLTSAFTTLRPATGNDTLTEECLALSDGHWILKRELAQQALHPAVEPLASLTRTHHRGVDSGTRARAAIMRALTKWRAHGDAIELGLHQPRPGSDLDRIARNMGKLKSWLYAEERTDAAAAARRWAAALDPGGEHS
jgi:flagellar biosynthesis/type III secretory pathway ATPase